MSVYFRVWGLSQRWCKPNNSCSLIHLWKQHLNRNEVLSNTVGRLFKASSLATRFHMLVISQCDEKNAFHYPISTPQKYNIEMAGYSFLLSIPEKKLFCPLFHICYMLSLLKGNKVVLLTIYEEFQKQPWTTSGSGILTQRCMETEAVSANLEGRPIPAENELSLQSSRNQSGEQIKHLSRSMTTQQKAALSFSPQNNCHVETVYLPNKACKSDSPQFNSNACHSTYTI